MSPRLYLILAFGLLAGMVHAEDKALFISKGGPVPLWISAEHKAGDTPLQLADTNELLLKEDAKGDYLYVVAKNGAKGWVEAEKLRPFEKATGTTINLNDVRVQGQLDNPGDVYILTDDSKIPPEGFYIVRDMTALITLDPIDRETLERRNGENF